MIAYPMSSAAIAHGATQAEEHDVERDRGRERDAHHATPAEAIGEPAAR
jgi:hypothetical protein